LDKFIYEMHKVALRAIIAAIQLPINTGDVKMGTLVGHFPRVALRLPKMKSHDFKNSNHLLKDSIKYAL
jgi:hypothetical protein